MGRSSSRVSVAVQKVLDEGFFRIHYLLKEKWWTQLIRICSSAGTALEAKPPVVGVAGPIGQLSVEFDTVEQMAPGSHALSAPFGGGTGGPSFQAECAKLTRDHHELDMIYGMDSSLNEDDQSTVRRRVLETI
jgi:hypothetical protein